MTAARQWNLALRWKVAEWLRYECQCSLIAFERPAVSSDAWTFRPDVLAVEKGRRLIEVEIKVSKADLLADAKKHRAAIEQHFGEHWNHWKKYFAVPPELVEAARAVVPAECGILSFAGEVELGAIVLGPSRIPLAARRGAKANQSAQRIAWPALLRMAQNQSGTVVSLAREAARAAARGTAETILTP